MQGQLRGQVAGVRDGKGAASLADGNGGASQGPGHGCTTPRPHGGRTAFSQLSLSLSLTAVSPPGPRAVARGELGRPGAGSSAGELDGSPHSTSISCPGTFSNSVVSANPLSSLI